MNSIVVTNAGHLRNNGIYAMFMGVYYGVINARKDVKFYLLSPRKEEAEEILKGKGITVIEEHWWLKRKNKISFFANVAWNIVYLLCGRFLNINSKYTALNAYRTCDLIVDLSGDSISTDYGSISFMFVLYRIILGLIAGKKVLLLGQTIGPFKNKFSSLIATNVLYRVTKIVLREEKSLGYLKDIKFSRKDLIVTADNGFLLEPDFDGSKEMLRKEKILFDGIVIGFSPSNIIYRWFKDDILKSERKNCYINNIANLIDWISERYGYKILLIPHVVLDYNNDAEICEKIYEKSKNKKSIFVIRNYYNASVLKAVMSYAKFVISFRMHAALSALSMGVPVICWSYNEKFEGIIGEKMGLLRYIINIRGKRIEESVENLKDAFKEMENSFDTIKVSVEKKISFIKKEANKNIEIIFEELNRA